MATAGSKLTRSFDDMDDSFEISFCREQVEAGHRRYLPLLNALTVSQELILPVFREADRRATHYRAKYQQISLGAVGMGLIAVMLGICEVILPEAWYQVSRDALTISEGLAAGFCLIFILLGTIYKPKNNWLLARYRAENLRLLKFKTLADPRLWCENGGPTDRSGETPADHVRADVRAAVRGFEGLVYEDVKESAAHGVIPDVSEIHCPESCEDALHEIIHYYCEKRLSTQMDYLTAKSEEDEKDGVVSSLLTNILFFVSFGLVLFHVALDSLHRISPKDRFGEALVLGAVLLPALVAGVRTYRASREFERNALRHRATLHSLEGLNVEMGKARNLAKKFRIARACELILEFDSSEFMRLLREVEWYG
jgi:hypothetical protein